MKNKITLMPTFIATNILCITINILCIGINIDTILCSIKKHNLIFLSFGIFALIISFVSMTICIYNIYKFYKS